MTRRFKGTEDLNPPQFRNVTQTTDLRGQIATTIRCSAAISPMFDVKERSGRRCRFNLVPKLDAMLSSVSFPAARYAELGLVPKLRLGNAYPQSSALPLWTAALMLARTLDIAGGDCCVAPLRSWSFDNTRSQAGAWERGHYTRRLNEVTLHAARCAELGLVPKLWLGNAYPQSSALPLWTAALMLARTLDIAGGDCCVDTLRSWSFDNMRSQAGAWERGH